MHTPSEILSQYKSGTTFKASLGNKGIFEQNRINERFYIGDQWYGAKCGNDRPLVRHNVIKRIADYKISNILSTPVNINYQADGIPSNSADNTISKTNEMPNNFEKKHQKIMCIFLNKN